MWRKKTMKRGCLENHCHLFQLFLGIAELVVTNLVSSPLSEPLESTSWESNSTLRISRNQCTVSKLGNLGLEWSTLKKIFLNRFSMKFTKNFMMICKHQNNWKGNHRLQISSSIFLKIIYNMRNIKFLALFCQLPLTWRPHHYELPLCTLSCAIEIWYRNIPFLISRINYILSLNVPLILLDPLFH